MRVFPPMQTRVTAVAIVLSACAASARAPTHVAPPPPTASASVSEPPPPVASDSLPDLTPEGDPPLPGPPIHVVMTAPPSRYEELGELAAAVPQIIFRGDASGSAFCPGIMPVRFDWDGPMPTATFVGMILPVAWREQTRVVATGSVVFSATWTPSLRAVRNGDLNHDEIEAPSLVASLGPLLGRALAACASSPEHAASGHPTKLFDRWTHPMTLERAGCVLAKHARSVGIEDGLGMLFVLDNATHTPIEVSASLGRHDDRLCLSGVSGHIPEF